MTWDAALPGRWRRGLPLIVSDRFEDILTPEQQAEQAALRPQIEPIRSAGGEHEFTHFGFAELARSNALDIWQPDVTWCGGITAMQRILELAVRPGVRVIPHRGGEVWGLHVIAATACADRAELVMGNRDAQSPPLWLDAPQPDRGYISVADAPGFGVQPNATMIE